MHKLITLVSLGVIAVTTVSCVAVITQPIKQRNCYGLEICKTNPAECQKDEETGLLYQTKTRISCKSAGGHT